MEPAGAMEELDTGPALPKLLLEVDWLPAREVERGGWC